MEIQKKILHNCKCMNDFLKKKYYGQNALMRAHTQYVLPIFVLQNQISVKKNQVK